MTRAEKYQKLSDLLDLWAVEDTSAAAERARLRAICPEMHLHSASAKMLDFCIRDLKSSGPCGKCAASSKALLALAAALQEPADAKPGALPEGWDGGRMWIAERTDHAKP